MHASYLVKSILSPRAWLLLCCLWLLSGTAQALELSQLKADGVVGERADGYLGLVQPEVAAEVAELVAEVNSKRKAQYQRIAAENALPLDKVEALAGKKTLAKTAVGHWVYIESWRRK